MILEQLTYNSFGYYSTDLNPGSHKKVIANCDDCGLLKIIENRKAHTLCKRCCQKGERSSQYAIPLSDEVKKRVSEGLKKGYADGTIKSWNDGLTKETNKSLMIVSEKVKKNHPMKNPETRKKVGLSNRGRTPWNKNLTAKDDSRILSGENHPMYGFVYSDETLKKMSDAKKGKYLGENNWNYKGGITPLMIAIRNCTKYIEWRRQIYKRDNWTCQQCSKECKGDINAHHTFPFVDILRIWNIKSLEEAYSCKALWSLDNGITLCKKCHIEFHKFDKIYKGTVTFEVINKQD